MGTGDSPSSCADDELSLAKTSAAPESLTFGPVLGSSIGCWKNLAYVADFC